MNLGLGIGLALGNRRASAPFNPDAYAWTEKAADADWEPRDGAGLVRFNGKLWILGGWDGASVATWDNRTTTNQVWSSDDDGATWTLELAHVTAPANSGAGARWVKRHNSSGFLTHTHSGTEYVYVIGGDHLSFAYDQANEGSSAGYLCDVWRSSDPGNADGWTRVADGTVGWAGRMLHVVSSHGGALYLMGGQNGLHGAAPYPFTSALTPTFYNDVWKSTDGGATWTQITANAGWSGRGIVSNAPSWNGRMWLCGGGRYPTSSPVDVTSRVLLNEVWSSADGITWTQHADATWGARQYHSVEVYAGRLWVMGGYDGVNAGAAGNLNDVWSTGDGETWVQHDNAPWVAGHADGTCVDAQGIWHGPGNGTLQGSKLSSVHLLGPT